MDANIKKYFFKDKSGYIPFNSLNAKKKFLSCERKNGYSNLIVNKIIKERSHQGVILYTYLCPNCNLWHLTHIKH